MIIQNCDHHKIKQQGFTLLELLIAMTLMLAVVLAVQLYISGVVVDQENISSRHDQNTQTRIALSNMQRDVAQAGSNAQLGSVNPNLGISVNDAANELVVSRVEAKATARDCNGNHINFKDSSEPWSMVSNTYTIAKTDVVALRCVGNGGNIGNWPHVDNVVSMRFSVSGLDANGDFTAAPKAAKQITMVSLCIVQSETTIRSFIAQPITQDCNGANIPPVAGRRFIRTQIDMPVYSSTFIAGTPP